MQFFNLVFSRPEYIQIYYIKFFLEIQLMLYNVIALQETGLLVKGV